MLSGTHIHDWLVSLTCDTLATRTYAHHLVPFFGPAEAANLENAVSRIVLVRPGTWVPKEHKEVMSTARARSTRNPNAVRAPKPRALNT